MACDADPRLVRLVRQLDAQRQELMREKQRGNALKMQNVKLRKALALLTSMRALEYEVHAPAAEAVSAVAVGPR
jgi:hypothetical protein